MVPVTGVSALGLLGSSDCCFIPGLRSGDVPPVMLISFSRYSPTVVRIPQLHARIDQPPNVVELPHIVGYSEWIYSVAKVQAYLLNQSSSFTIMV